MGLGPLGKLYGTLFGDGSDAYNDLEDTTLAKDYAYTPENVSAEGYDAAQEGSNALAGLHGDAGAQSAQRRALAQLEGASHGGMNAADRAALFTAQQQLGQQARGAQGAIMQGAAARGATNSGSTLAAQLSAQQAAQEAGATAGAAVAGQAANRALGATQAAAGVAGNMDQASSARQAAIGTAQNAMNARNAASTNASRQFGAGAHNDAAKFNAARGDAAHQFNAGLAQQDFGNALGKRGGQASATNATAQGAYNLTRDIAGGVGGYLSQPGAQSRVAEDGGSGDSLGNWRGQYKEVPTVDLAQGGPVPGKAAVPGDSAKNDTVPAMLSPGEVVVPRSALNSPDRLLAFLEKETGMHFDDAMKTRKVK